MSTRAPNGKYYLDDCPECGTAVFERDEPYWTDGEQEACSDCGVLLYVSIDDAEEPPTACVNLVEEGREPMKQQYRVTWMRAGFRRAKVREFGTEAGARRFILLFSAEPWKYDTKRGPDDLWCCSGGPECSCEGITVREYHEKTRAEVPALIWARLESRQVGEWGCRA